MSFKGFVEGGIAAVVAGCATHPLDLIKVRMQLQGEAHSKSLSEGQSKKSHVKMAVQGGVLGVGLQIVQKEGALALFSGVSASALRHAMYSTTRLGLYEVLKQQWADEDGKLPISKKILAGMIAGAIGAAVGNPADVAMVRMQADGRLPFHQRRNYSSVADALFQMVSTEGFSSLWRGSFPTIQRAMVVTAAQLASYDQIKESLLASEVMRDGFATHFAASFLAGLVASIVSNPIDVVKTRIQNMMVVPGLPPPYVGSLDCALKTIQSEGPLALYKGFVPNVTRQGPFTITLFITLEQIRCLLRNF
ncbi:hypothetical protein GOP47_0024354 [Adiantum capillus-veneris]|uniref:Uncharacterized protein n=1 Tax=Adiantum capillus-veneris TaxID=13818 RepID=A0A9D4Z3L5_ADICA|nr:hypothetical protein GOP47_0024354 [Adiantum capillus-veneris]